jgi:hypothetical protein
MLPAAGNKTDRINKMNRITANQGGGKPHSVNPVDGFALNEIAGKFASAMPSINPSHRCMRLI